MLDDLCRDDGVEQIMNRERCTFEGQVDCRLDSTDAIPIWGVSKAWYSR